MTNKQLDRKHAILKCLSHMEDLEYGRQESYSYQPLHYMEETRFGIVAKLCLPNYLECHGLPYVILVSKFLAGSYRISYWNGEILLFDEVDEKPLVCIQQVMRTMSRAIGVREINKTEYWELKNKKKMEKCREVSTVLKTESDGV